MRFILYLVSMFLKKISIVVVTILVLSLLSKFMYVVPIHVGAFFITIVAVIIADSSALAWMLGRKKLLEKKTLHLLHNIVNFGLLVIVVTGVLMFIPLQDYLLEVPVFMGKMVFVLALIINSFVIGKHVNLPTTRSYASLSKSEKIPLLISGAVSTMSWLGAFILAHFSGV